MLSLGKTGEGWVEEVKRLSITITCVLQGWSKRGILELMQIKRVRVGDHTNCPVIQNFAHASATLYLFVHSNFPPLLDSGSQALRVVITLRLRPLISELRSRCVDE
jgi:hypothetical protein